MRQVEGRGLELGFCRQLQVGRFDLILPLPQNIPLTGSPPTVLTTLEYCSLPPLSPLSISCKLQGYLKSTNILLECVTIQEVASSMSPAPQGEQRAALPGPASGGVQRAALPGPFPGGVQRAALPGPGG